MRKAQIKKYLTEDELIQKMEADINKAKKDNTLKSANSLQEHFELLGIDE